MSLCNQCGKEVRWARRSNGRTHPPLEYVGTLLVVGAGNVVREEAAYVKHECHPDDVRIWEEIVDQQEKQQSDYKAVVERAQEKSRTVECRRCGSDVNVACKNLTERKKGNEVDTVWPHEERLEDAGWDMAANWLEVTESTTVRPSE